MKIETVYVEFGYWWDDKWNVVYTAKEDTMEKLSDAIGTIKADPERFRKYEPGNGWGNVGRMLCWLRSVRRVFHEYPNGTVRVSR